MGMQERYRVTCDTPKCKGRGPWRTSDDEAQKAAEKAGWTWELVDEARAIARDICPACQKEKW